jgi:hypothetical protein
LDGVQTQPCNGGPAEQADPTVGFDTPSGTEKPEPADVSTDHPDGRSETDNNSVRNPALDPAPIAGVVATGSEGALDARDVVVAVGRSVVDELDDGGGACADLVEVPCPNTVSTNNASAIAAPRTSTVSSANRRPDNPPSDGCPSDEEATGCSPSPLPQSTEPVSPLARSHLSDLTGRGRRSAVRAGRNG